jgi:hypothetical protein
MSDKLREAAKAALKNAKSLFLGCGDFNHLKKDLHDGGKCPPLQRYNDALAALEAALAEPAIKESLTVAEQEPVACIKTNGELMWLKKPSAIYSKPRPLYTAPPRREWVGLTAEDMADAHNSTSGDVMMRLAGFARAIEAKLRKKNT